MIKKLKIVDKIRPTTHPKDAFVQRKNTPYNASEICIGGKRLVA